MTIRIQREAACVPAESGTKSNVARCFHPEEMKMLKGTMIEWHSSSSAPPQATHQWQDPRGASFSPRRISYRCAQAAELAQRATHQRICQ